MKIIKLDNDLIDHKGILLLAKGNRIVLSDEKYYRLQRLGVFDHKTLIADYPNEEESLNVLDHFHKNVKEEFDESQEFYESHSVDDTIAYEVHEDEDEDVIRSFFDKGREAPHSKQRIERQKKVEYTLSKLDTTQVHAKKAAHCIIDLSKKLDLNEKSFNRATEIVIDITNNFENAKWYNYYLTLTNYVDWLFSHSINAALISTAIAIEMNFDNRRVRQIALGAILHDIGLILLPKEILLKPCVLSDMENEIVKRHCELGYAMLQNANLPRVAKEIILEHHECLDGSGFPNGLTDEEISKEAKIVMIAESFDTATTDSNYKKGKRPRIAIAEMMSKPKIYSREIVQVLANCILEE